MIGEDHFSPPRPGVLHPELWHSRDQHGTEMEVTDGIAGLVRMIQPEYCLETGTYLGHTAMAIAQALQSNGHGMLDSVEINPDYCSEAHDLVRGLPAKIHVGDSLKFTPRQPIDFIFLDSGDKRHREDEFRHFYKWMHNFTIAVFHDTWASYESASMVLTSVVKLAEEKMLVPVFLPTPRGLAVCRVKK